MKMFVLVLVLVPRFFGRYTPSTRTSTTTRTIFSGDFSQPDKMEVMIMFGSSVKIDADLLKRCKQHAQDAGYSSVEEFIAHVLERELKSKQEESEKDQEEIARRLQGLGYIE
jgi:hypothetical protein